MPSLEVHEAKISMLERQYTSTEQSLKTLADDMKKIVEISLQQAEDRSALKRAFESINDLKAKFEERELQFLHQKIKDQQDRMEASERNKKAAWMEVFKMGIIVASSIALYHFGIKLL